MRSFSRFCLPALAFVAVQLIACKKYKDEPGQSHPALSRTYCNDPEAVNYNLGFPGTADNSICYYPSDAFSGEYRFADSIFGGNNNFLRADSLLLRVTAVNRTVFHISGFCPGSESLRFTANRALRATADTTALKGQVLCRPKDTLSGTATQSLGDSSRILFVLTVLSDTGTTTHRGTAYRQ